MKLKFLIPIAAIIVLISCNKMNQPNPEQEQLPLLTKKTNTVEVPQEPLFSKTELDELVLNTLETKKDFRWQWMDIKALCSAAQYNEQIMAIGYKPSGFGDITTSLHNIKLSDAVWKQTHDALIDLIITGVNKNNTNPLSWKDILIEDDPKLPIITVKLSDASVITALYNLENVRYIEPMGYWPGNKERSSSGCSASATSLNTADWTTITPGCRLPWNFNNTNIPAAWNIAQGQGITIGVIDAGISSSQTLLGSSFNNGESNVNRTVTTDFTYGNSAYTSCTHGTSMSGLAVGPRNNSNATTGVAYKSNLHFIRACADVVLDESAEQTGLKNALVKMGDRDAVRIVSMSIGTPFYSSVIYDGVVYAYNKGKMLVAAAGTSYSWLSWWGVVYPAVHSQCIAVTGVKENSTTCSSCHDGSEVDFTLIMERSINSNRNSLSLPLSGTTPTYIGGSSCATAMFSGVAALIWSAKPSLTREQVYTAIRNTSQYYPSVNSSRGYGNINASAAMNLALTY
jgi:hypothetical protein